MPKKNSHKDSTTDFFLKFITRQKEEKDPKSATTIDKEEVKTNDKTYRLLLKGVNNVNILLDKMLESKISVKILSFVMTILLVFVINGGSIDSILRSPTPSDRLTDVEVKVEGLNPDYEVSGVPETVDVIVLGPTMDIYATKVSKNYQVYIDLTNLVEGEHVVEYKYRNFSSGLDVLVASEKVTVTISKKTTKTMSLSYRFENEETLDDEQSVSVTSMEHDKVEIRASEDTIGKIVTVDAVIDVSDIDSGKGTFSQTAKIRAYDRSGEVVKKVEIIPDKVKVDGKISTFSKEVSVVPNIIGKVEAGYAVSKVDLERTKITIYGDEEKLKNVKEVFVTVDVTGYNDSRTIEEKSVIEKLDGINKMSETELKIKVDIEKAETKTVSNIPITVLNNTNQFKINFNTGEGEASVDVTAATSVIEKIGANDFKATIDLSKAEEGQQVVFVSVSSTNYLLDYVLISKEKLIITLER